MKQSKLEHLAADLSEPASDFDPQTGRPAAVPSTEQPVRARDGVRHRLTVSLTQLLVLVGALLVWHYLPRLQGVFEGIRFLDPYFISSPERTWSKLRDLLSGSNGGPLVWPFVWPTFGSAVAGTAIGLIVGGVAGLILSSFRFLSDVLRPFVVAMNAVPRIALIPIVVVIFGTGSQSSTIIAVMVVFFIGLFNAYEGGRSVESHVLDNVRLLGASGWQVMRRVRAPYALAWTLASLPLAVSFAIVSVVTGEILTGYAGIGQLISQASTSSDVDLTFAVIIILSLLALVILGVAEIFKRRVLHWWIQPD